MDNQSSISSSLDAMFPNTEGTTPTVTKMHFIEMLKEHVGLSRTEANEVVESIFVLLQQALTEGREIKLANFGTFSTRDKQARPGRNPRTGAPYEISARRVVTFLPAPFMRDAVAGYAGPVSQEGA